MLCPTRELADQVTAEIRRLARADDNIKAVTLCGGVPLRGQLATLEHGAHIVVGTPGRVMDHLARASLNLEALNTLVLDEADRMLDMGFFDDIVTVARQCPKERQTLLFSATYPEGIAKLAAQFMREPVTVKVQAQHALGQIEQRWYEVQERERIAAVSLLLNHFRPASTLAFCNTKAQCRKLADALKAQGFSALALYGELEQRERDQVLVRFANRSCSVLVATDVAARGLDIANLAAVINVDVTPDPEIHIHRIGRTGRAGLNSEGTARGLALNLVSMDEMGSVGKIEVLQGRESEWHKLGELKPASAQAHGAAHGHTAHPGRAQGKDPSRRRAGRPHRRPGLCPRTDRQDRRQRVFDLCRGPARCRARGGTPAGRRPHQGQERQGAGTGRLKRLVREGASKLPTLAGEAACPTPSPQP